MRSLLITACFLLFSTISFAGIESSREFTTDDALFCKVSANTSTSWTKQTDTIALGQMYSDPNAFRFENYKSVNIVENDFYGDRAKFDGTIRVGLNLTGHGHKGRTLRAKLSYMKKKKILSSTTAFFHLVVDTEERGLNIYRLSMDINDSRSNLKVVDLACSPFEDFI